jgi:hypothetical protein
MSSNDNQNVLGARYSAISAMHQCRLLAWSVYGKKMVGFKNHFAKFGIVIHNVLEEYGNHCLANKLETDYGKFEEIKFKQLHYLEEFQLKEATELLNKIKENINWGGALQFETATIERRYKITDKFQPSVDEENPYLSGGIDLVYLDSDTAYVEDYKSVRAIYTDAYMRDSLQRKIYAGLIFAEYPQINTVKFAFNFIRYGFKSKYYDEYRENIEELNSLIRAEVTSLYELLAEPEPPEANPSGFCMLCEIRGTCPAYQNAYAFDEKLETTEQALALYGKFRLAEVKLKETKELLKAWIEINGPIKLKYEEYGPQPEEKETYPDTQKVIEILKTEHKIPEGAIYECLNFTKTSINKLLKKFKIKNDDRKSLDKIKTVETNTKFKEVKIHEIEQDEEEGGIIDPYM